MLALVIVLLVGVASSWSAKPHLVSFESHGLTRAIFDVVNLTRAATVHRHVGDGENEQRFKMLNVCTNSSRLTKCSWGPRYVVSMQDGYVGRKEGE